jgi:hypothetical protein
MPEPSTRLATSDMSVAGGHNSISNDGFPTECTASARDEARSADSALNPFIFQLPAINNRLVFIFSPY